MKVRVSFVVDVDEWQYKELHLLDTNAEVRQDIKSRASDFLMDLADEGVLK